MRDVRATEAGVVISAGSIFWTAGTWVQARLDARDGGERRPGRVIAGISLMTAGILVIAVPAILGEGPDLTLALAGWIICGLGMGLAITTSGVIAFARAPEGKEGSVSSSMLLVDLFVPATCIGAGNALVALGSSPDGDLRAGISLAFGLSVLLVALALLCAFRLSRGEPAGQVLNLL